MAVVHAVGRREIDASHVDVGETARVSASDHSPDQRSEVRDRPQEIDAVITSVQSQGIALSSLQALGLDSLHETAMARQVAELLAESDAVKKAKHELHRSKAQRGFALRGAQLLVSGIVRTRGSIRKDFLVHQRHPALRAMGQHPSWWRLATTALGKPARLLDASAWVTLVPPKRGYIKSWSQNWHRDPLTDMLPDGTITRADWNHTLKIFWYVRDVGIDTGPFEYLRGSQNNQHPEWCEPGKYALPMMQPKLEQLDAYMAVTGPADTVIVANTSGIHRGGFCTTTPRVSVTLVYVAD